jgi:hypothetical protein
MTLPLSCSGSGSSCSRTGGGSSNRRRCCWGGLQAEVHRVELIPAAAAALPLASLSPLAQAIWGEAFRGRNETRSLRPR